MKKTLLKQWPGLVVAALMVLVGPVQAMEMPQLRLKTYAQLAFPPQLSRAELQWMLQTAASGLHGLAFEDMGDMSDFMHGHVVFQPLDGSEAPAKDLNDLSWTPDWSKLEAKAVLFHTQEFGYLRQGVPFLGPNGKLNGLDYNWLLFLKDNAKASRGELGRGRDWHRDPVADQKFTVRVSDLDPRYFGPRPGSWEYAFYFFRIHCADLDALGSVERIENSNLLDVKIGSERVCLALENFHCRSASRTSDLCRGEKDLASQQRFSDDP